MNISEEQVQFDVFEKLHKEFGQYVSGPWLDENNLTATLDGYFTAAQLRQVADALDKAKRL